MPIWAGDKTVKISGMTVPPSFPHHSERPGCATKGMSSPAQQMSFFTQLFISLLAVAKKIHYKSESLVNLLIQECQEWVTTSHYLVYLESIYHQASSSQYNSPGGSRRPPQKPISIPSIIGAVDHQPGTCSLYARWKHQNSQAGWRRGIFGGESSS